MPKSNQTIRILINATLIGISVSAFSAVAADYHVSNAGSDDNPGTMSAPWRSIARVNRADLRPGDRVLLQRGGRWAESLTPSASGTPDNAIVFAAYGNGDYPIITGASNKSCISWYEPRSHLVFRNLHLKDCGRIGLDVWSEGGISTGLVIEESLLEGAAGINLFMSGVEGVLIRANTIRDARSQHGIYIDGSLGAADVIIEDNRISGNGDMCVQLNSNALARLTDVVLRYNDMSNCSAGGLNNIGANGVQVHHNLIYGPMPGIYNGCDGADSGCRHGAIDGVYENNTIVTTGNGWAACFSNTSGLGTPTFASFTNNICVHDAASGVALEQGENTEPSRVDHNLYFSNRSSQVPFEWRGTYYDSFASYQSATGRDSNGVFDNPLFADSDRNNFALASGSPAIDSGDDLGYSRDQIGNPVPSGSAPDRGALEALGDDAGEESPEAPEGLQIDFLK